MCSECKDLLSAVQHLTIDVKLSIAYSAWVLLVLAVLLQAGGPSLCTISTTCCNSWLDRRAP
jgi:hypothetical protein